VLAGFAKISRFRSSVPAELSLSRLACAGGSTSARSGTGADSVRPPSVLRAIILKFSGFGG
jgi:hypothetical protein